MTSWDPAQYRKFSGHRLRPALDLLAAVPLDAPDSIVDLGCGEGRVTKLLAERWPNTLSISTTLHRGPRGRMTFGIDRSRVS